MGKCKLRRYVRNGDQLLSEECTCDEIPVKTDAWLKEFREENATDTIEKSGRKDQAYERYKEEINDFINQCKCRES